MLTGFLKTLLIIGIIYYGIKLIAKFVMPYVLRRFFRNMENNYYQKRHDNRAGKQEGEITIEQNPETGKKKYNRDKGDYVDYEESN